VPDHANFGFGTLVACSGPGSAEAVADDGIKRLPVARGAVETADVGPVAGLGEALRDLTETPGLVEQAPAGDGFCRLTSIGKGNDERCARPQHPGDLADHFAGSPQILDRAADRGAIELAGAERQGRVAVEILNPPFVEERVLQERAFVDADPDDAAERRFR